MNDFAAPKATLDLMILDALSDGRSYGYRITQLVLARSEGRFEIKEGALYPALHRLERGKLLSATWGEEAGRRRKYYALTAAGRRQLTARKADWTAYVAAVESVLAPRPLERPTAGASE